MLFLYFAFFYSPLRAGFVELVTATMVPDAAYFHGGVSAVVLRVAALRPRTRTVPVARVIITIRMNPRRFNHVALNTECYD